MRNDAIVCAIYKYNDYSIVRPWINSIKSTGFRGSIIVVAINVSDEMCRQIRSNGVIVSQHTDTSQTHPNVLRFKYVNEFLSTRTYNKVIITDARDVVFQVNPFNYLYSIDQKYKIVSSSENILIKNESWMRNNLINTFGNDAYEELKDKEALCAGVIAGESEHLSSLCGEIYDMSIVTSASTANTSQWKEQAHWSTWSKDPSDQAAYNVLLRSDKWADVTKVSGIDENWNINMGVSTYNSLDVLVHPTGKIVHDTVKNSRGEFFHIVHQYDRINQLKDLVLEKYLR